MQAAFGLNAEFVVEIIHWNGIRKFTLENLTLRLHRLHRRFRGVCLDRRKRDDASVHATVSPIVDGFGETSENRAGVAHLRRVKSAKILLSRFPSDLSREVVSFKGADRLLPCRKERPWNGGHASAGFRGGPRNGGGPKKFRKSVLNDHEWTTWETRGSCENSDVNARYQRFCHVEERNVE